MQGTARCTVDALDGSPRDTAKALFPNVRQVNCYELYTLHLGVVPAKTVLAQNKRLVKKLRESRGPRPSGGLPRFGV